jgi:hypothetical protein
MRTGRRPRLPNPQTPEERALWKTIRAELSERRRQKRQKCGLASNREADLYIPTIVRHAAEKDSSRALADSKIIPFPKP